jgi:putative chitinase
MQNVYQVAASGLNLRELPDGQAEILVTLPKGHFVTRLDERDWGAGWWRVEADHLQMTYHGYVAAQHLTPYQPKPAAPPGALSVTADQLRKVAPNGAPDLCLKLAQAMNRELPAHQINTPNRIAHFVAQMAHQTDFRRLEQLADASVYARYEQMKALGNTQPGDGARYRGRGLIMLTGRKNYRDYGVKVGLDLEANPELAAEPEVAVKVACRYWADRAANDAADKDDPYLVTRLLTGGLPGIEDRVMKLKIAQSIWHGGSGATRPGSSPALALNAASVGQMMEKGLVELGKQKKIALLGQKNRTLIAQLAPHLAAQAAGAGLANARRMAHFLGQCALESDYFRTLSEYASGTAYEGRASLGNSQPGDGPRFKGRGLIQLTGRNNYTKASQALGLGSSLVNTPELVATEPALGVRASLWWWTENKVNAICDGPGNLEEVSRRVSRQVNRGNANSPNAANHENERVFITRVFAASMGLGAA